VKSRWSTFIQLDNYQCVTYTPKNVSRNSQIPAYH